jgi:hypothetical protein
MYIPIIGKESGTLALRRRVFRDTKTQQFNSTFTEEKLWHSLLWGVNAHVLYPIGGCKAIFINKWLLITVNKINKMVWW